MEKCESLLQTLFPKLISSAECGQFLATHYLQQQNQTIHLPLSSLFPVLVLGKVPSLRPAWARQRESGHCRPGHCWLDHHAHRTWGRSSDKCRRGERTIQRIGSLVSVAQENYRWTYLRNTAWGAVLWIFATVRGVIMYFVDIRNEKICSEKSVMRRSYV